MERLRRDLEKILGEKFGVSVRRPINSFAKEAKDASQGTTLMANGIAGGKYSNLIKLMKITEAKGTVLDYIFFPDFNKKAVIEKLRNA